MPLISWRYKSWVVPIACKSSLIWGHDGSRSESKKERHFLSVFRILKGIKESSSLVEGNRIHSTGVFSSLIFFALAGVFGIWSRVFQECIWHVLQKWAYQRVVHGQAFHAMGLTNLVRCGTACFVREEGFVVAFRNENSFFTSSWSSQAGFSSNCRFESSDISAKAFVVSPLWNLHSNLPEEIRDCRDGFDLLGTKRRWRSLVTGSIGWYLGSIAHLNSSKESRVMVQGNKASPPFESRTFPLKETHSIFHVFAVIFGGVKEQVQWEQPVFNV